MARFNRFLLALLVLFSVLLLLSFSPVSARSSPSSVSVSVSVNVTSHSSRRSRALSRFLDSVELDSAAEPEPPRSSVSRTIGSLALDALPIVGTVKAAQELITGKDLVTGEKVPKWAAAAGLGLGLIPAGRLIGGVGTRLATKAVGSSMLRAAPKLVRHVPSAVAQESVVLAKKAANLAVTNPALLAKALWREQISGFAAKELAASSALTSAPALYDFEKCRRQAKGNAEKLRYCELKYPPNLREMEKKELEAKKKLEEQKKAEEKVKTELFPGK